MKKEDALEHILKSVANRRRISILTFLKKYGAQPVSAIAQATGGTIQTTSKHLQILRDADIIIDRRRGMSVLYRLSLAQNELIKPLLRSL